MKSYTFDDWTKELSQLTKEGKELEKNLGLTPDIRKYTGPVSPCPIKAIEDSQRYLEDIMSLSCIKRAEKSHIDPWIVKDLEKQIIILKKKIESKDQNIATLIDALGKKNSEEVEIE